MHFSSDVWSKLATTRVFDMVITHLLHSYLMHLGGNDRSCRKKSTGLLTLTHGKNQSQGEI